MGQAAHFRMPVRHLPIYPRYPPFNHVQTCSHSPWRIHLEPRKPLHRLAGCSGAPPEQVVDFDIGGSSDPIVQAQQALGEATDTVTLTLKNSTNYNFTQGLVLFSVPFVVNGAASPKTPVP